jgi:hypothetical protein
MICWDKPIALIPEGQTSNDAGFKIQTGSEDENMLRRYPRIIV